MKGEREEREESEREERENKERERRERKTILYINRTKNWRGVIPNPTPPLLFMPLHRRKIWIYSLARIHIV